MALEPARPTVNFGSCSAPLAEIRFTPADSGLGCGGIVRWLLILTSSLAACDSEPERAPLGRAAFRGSRPQVTVQSPSASSPPAAAFDAHGPTLAAIAAEIEGLAATFPALEEFDADENLDLERLRIVYQHRVQRVVVERGRKRELVVEPGPGGIYLYIDFHEDAERDEARSQVFRGYFRNQGRRVRYVVRTGAQSRPLEERLWKILAAHGTTSHGLGSNAE